MKSVLLFFSFFFVAILGQPYYWDFSSSVVVDSKGCNGSPFLNQWCPDHIGEHNITVDYNGNESEQFLFHFLISYYQK